MSKRVQKLGINMRMTVLKRSSNGPKGKGIFWHESHQIFGPCKLLLTTLEAQIEAPWREPGHAGKRPVH